MLPGIPRTARLLDTNDQLRDRFREVIEIERLSIAPKPAALEFCSALRTFKRYLKDLPTIDISSPDVTSLFAFATDGRLRDIRRLLVRAVELAYEQPNPKLTNLILAESFRQVIYPRAPDDRNPFHQTFNKTPLVRIGEPFTSDKGTK